MCLAVATVLTGTAQAGTDLVTKPSQYSVPETIDRIERAAELTVQLDAVGKLLEATVE